MRTRSSLLESLGGEEGCRILSAAFYARVGKDPVLRPFFPGKSLRCATEEFSAFLIQFLGGNEEHTQFRWWLSLRESHARFQKNGVLANARIKRRGQNPATLFTAKCFQQTTARAHGSDCTVRRYSRRLASIT